MHHRSLANGRSGSRLRLLGLAVLALFAARPAGAAEPAAPDKAFVGDHCTSCHNAEDKKGRLDLTGLAFDPKDPANLAVWVKVHDRVTAGEMPPRSRPRPDAARQKAFVEGLAQSIVAAERAALAGEGRATLRRLNRHEYENALRDLLGVPWAQVANRLPEDGEAYRFNKSGEALDVSYLQMARFMDSADYAMRLAMATRLERPAKTTRKLYARDEPSLRNWWPRENGTLPDRLSFPVLDSHAQPDVRAGRAPATSPETREREAVGKVSSIFSDAGGYSWSGWRAPVAARYKLRIAGYTIWVAGGGVARWFYEGQGAEKAPVYHTLLWHRPNLDEVYPGRRNEPIGVYASGGGQTRPIGAVDFTPKPTVSEIEVFLLAGEVMRTDGSRLFRTRVNGTDEQYVNPLATEDGMPGYAVQWIEVEGPFYDDPVGGAGYRLLFDQLKLVPSKEARTGVPLEIGPAPAAGPGPGGGRRRGGPGGFGRGAIREAPYEVESAAPREDAERLLRSFLKTAYRRPVAEADVQRFLALFDDQFRQGHGFTRSMLSAYTAVLASPGFVFVEEKPGRLDDHALATRLALFLWNSIPDDTLRALADRGELRKPGRAAGADRADARRPEVAAVRRGVHRLLARPAEDRRHVAVHHALQRLRTRRPAEAGGGGGDAAVLRRAAAGRPAGAEHRRFGLHVPQRAAGRPLRHPRRRGRRVPQGDAAGRQRPRRADDAGQRAEGDRQRHDDLAGAARALDHGAHPRAGDAAPAAVGRGRRAGHPRRGDDPPAAGQAPGRRELRVLPQQDGPAGLRAGELRRDGRLPRALPGGVRQGAAGQGLRHERAGVRSSTTPCRSIRPASCPTAGRSRTCASSRSCCSQDERPIARNLVRQLTVFATGAPVRFSDREEIEKILDAAKASEYGVRSLVHAIVQSELFRNK